jgi:hypothetical protein
VTDNLGFVYAFDDNSAHRTRSFPVTFEVAAEVSGFEVRLGVTACSEQAIRSIRRMQVEIITRDFVNI